MLYTHKKACNGGPVNKRLYPFMGTSDICNGGQDHKKWFFQNYEFMRNPESSQSCLNTSLPVKKKAVPERGTAFCIL